MAHSQAGLEWLDIVYLAVQPNHLLLCLKFFSIHLSESLSRLPAEVVFVMAQYLESVVIGTSFIPHNPTMNKLGVLPHPAGLPVLPSVLGEVTQASGVPTPEGLPVVRRWSGCVWAGVGYHMSVQLLRGEFVEVEVV